MRKIITIIILLTVAFTLYAVNLTEKHTKTLEKFTQKKLSGETLKKPIPLFSDQATLTSLFCSAPFSDKGTVETYFAVDGKTVYFFCKYNSQFFTEKIKFATSLYTLKDPCRIRLLDTGYFNPETIYTYLAHTAFIEANRIKLDDYFYRSFFPNRPHPAINYAALKKETIATIDEVIAFIKMYDETLYAYYSDAVKKQADTKLR